MGQPRIGLVADETANELVAGQPSRPPADWPKDGHGAAIDGDGHVLTRFHAGEKGPGCVPQFSEATSAMRRP